jgi:hypothetical protein
VGPSSGHRGEIARQASGKEAEATTYIDECQSYLEKMLTAAEMEHMFAAAFPVAHGIGEPRPMRLLVDFQ